MALNGSVSAELVFSGENLERSQLLLGFFGGIFGKI